MYSQLTSTIRSTNAIKQNYSYFWLVVRIQLIWHTSHIVSTHGFCHPNWSNLQVGCNLNILFVLNNSSSCSQDFIPQWIWCLFSRQLALKSLWKSFHQLPSNTNPISQYDILFILYNRFEPLSPNYKLPIKFVPSLPQHQHLRQSHHTLKPPSILHPIDLPPSRHIHLPILLLTHITFLIWLPTQHWPLSLMLQPYNLPQTHRYLIQLTPVFYLPFPSIGSPSPFKILNAYSTKTAIDIELCPTIIFPFAYVINLCVIYAYP